ncbi:MAG: iron hydrogenase, partial [Bacilli bacterium]|nr:iron hydrogenase [Bacilli bacterium]
QAKCISMALTPMVLTGRLIKKLHPNCKVVFIGPCSAKKLEASRKKVRSDIDFVLTFEEMVGIFEAKNIDLDDLEEKEMDFKASEDGRGFAASGGVAQAVVDCIKKDYPNMEINVMKADGLDNCYKMMLAAKAGKYDGYLLEGMACPGGCVAGAGTMLDINKATKELNEHKKKAPFKESNNTQYKEYLDLLD